jgi:GNAT superfamily N-acetyltransferase
MAQTFRTSSTGSFRVAQRADLEAIIGLLIDDDLGTTRERSDDLSPYESAFEDIAADPNNEILVCEEDGAIVACLQLTYIPNLTHRGARRALIEGVRVARSHRGSGLGSRIIRFAVARASSRGCRMVQLTTDQQRPEALRFYENLGFKNTHHGLKLHLAQEKP